MFLEISQNSQEKHLCQSLFFNKVAGLGPGHLWWLLLYEIISVNYFYVRHKNRRKHNQHFKLLFFKLNSHIGASNYKYLHVGNQIYLFGCLFSIKANNTHADQTSLQSCFFFCPNQNDSQTFKSSSCKKFLLQRVCCRCNLLR